MKCKRIRQYILFIISPGISIFILLPSVVFYFVESDWTYVDSVYYTFVSLTTIGFGDFVNSHHGHETKERFGIWVWAYRGFTMLWLVFGMSFIFMIQSLVVDEIQSSKICPRIVRGSFRGSIRLQSESTKKVVNHYYKRNPLKPTKSLPINDIQASKICPRIVGGSLRRSLRLQSESTKKVVKHLKHKPLTHTKSLPT